MAKAKFVYVTYVSTTPARLWKALIDPKITAKYWQHENISEWKRGSRWVHRSSADPRKIALAGKVLEFTPPRRLVLTWAFLADEARRDRQSKLTIELKPYRSVVRLTVTHDRLAQRSEMLAGITDGWPKVLSSLKTLLETGRPLPQLW